MQSFPTPDGGMDRSRMVQKSFGVMSRVCVPPKACLGAEAAMGNMRVGLRCDYGRVPPGGQERLRGESGRDEIIEGDRGGEDGGRENGEEGEELHSRIWVVRELVDLLRVW